jgi:hypothetical protein
MIVRNFIDMGFLLLAYWRALLLSFYDRESAAAGRMPM